MKKTMNNKSILAIFFAALVAYSNISISSPDEVTAVINKIGDFSESGDGFTFTTKEGNEYYIYVANDHVKGGEYLIESEEKKIPICLKLNPEDGMGDIASVSKGSCSSSIASGDWYISTAEPALIVRDAPGVNGKNIGSIPIDGKVKVVDKTNKTESINGFSGEWVQIEWRGTLGYVFDHYLIKPQKIKTKNQSSSSDGKKKISCSNYFYKMEELAITAQLPDNYINRYHEAVADSLCKKDTGYIDSLVDNGYIDIKEVISISKILGVNYKEKKRSEEGESYGYSNQKFLDMGLCNACSANVADYYIKKPSSQCGKLAKKALEGNPDAIKILQNYPEYCIVSS